MKSDYWLSVRGMLTIRVNRKPGMIKSLIATSSPFLSQVCVLNNTVILR